MKREALALVILEFMPRNKGFRVRPGGVRG